MEIHAVDAVTWNGADDVIAGNSISTGRAQGRRRVVLEVVGDLESRSERGAP